MNPELQQLFRAFEATYSKIDARLTRMEERLGITPADPFAGHPELPLDPTLPAYAPPNYVDGVTGEPIDPTLRILPWGDLPAPPEAPEGKMWVNRGSDWTYDETETPGRELRYLADGGWHWTSCFSCQLPHIELVDAPL